MHISVNEPKKPMPRRQKQAWRKSVKMIGMVVAEQLDVVLAGGYDVSPMPLDGIPSIGSADLHLVGIFLMLESVGAQC